MKLDIGCGDNKKPGFVGVDVFPHPCVDYVVDIDKEPLPFKNNSVSYLRCSHCLEHIFNLTFVMNEIMRVCRNNATVEIIVPHFKCLPCEEHIREFRHSSLKNYEYLNNNMGYVKFLIPISRKLVFHSRLFQFLFGNHPSLFEKFYPFRVFVELAMVFQVVKK